MQTAFGQSLSLSLAVYHTLWLSISFACHPATPILLSHTTTQLHTRLTIPSLRLGPGAPATAAHRHREMAEALASLLQDEEVVAACYAAESGDDIMDAFDMRMHKLTLSVLTVSWWSLLRSIWGWSLGLACLHALPLLEVGAHARCNPPLRSLLVLSLARSRTSVRSPMVVLHAALKGCRTSTDLTLTLTLILTRNLPITLTLRWKAAAHPQTYCGWDKEDH